MSRHINTFTKDQRAGIVELSTEWPYSQVLDYVASLREAKQEDHDQVIEEKLDQSDTL